MKESYLAFLYAFIGVIFFSSKAVMVKLAYNYDVDALSLLLLRMLFALPVYLVVALSSLRKLKGLKVSNRNYANIFFLGLLGYYLASYLDFKGLGYIAASLERLILFVYPTLVLILSSIFMGKKAGKRQIIAVGVTYIGIVLAFYHNANFSGEDKILGVVLIFFSALAYAIYLIGSGELILVFGTKLFTSIAMIIATLASLIHFAVLNEANLWGFSREVYVLAIAMAIISTIIPSFLISEAIRIIGSSNVAIIGSFGPVSTIILASIFLEEQISFYQILGTGVVISGIVLLANRRKDSKKAALVK